MKGKKLISFFMALIMVFTTASTALAAFFEEQDLQVNNSIRKQLLLHNGVGGDVGFNNFAPAMVTWTHPDTGNPYYAYCVNPALAGQGDSGVNYKMDLLKIFDDSDIVDAGGSGGNGKTGMKNLVAGAIANGFPNKSPDELGVKDDYAAYYATKMAIWALIHDNYANLDNWKANSAAVGSEYTLQDLTNVENAMKLIVGEAKKYTGSNDIGATVNPVGGMQTVGTDFVQEYEVTVTGATGDRYYVALGTNTAGAVITDVNGTTKTSTDSFAIDENFKIKAPIPTTLPYDIMANFSLRVVTDAPVCVYAEPSDPLLKNKKQNYVFYGQGAVTASGTFQADKGNPPSDDPGDWTIYKLDAKTGEPLPGVTFDIYNNAGQLIDSGTTGADGIYVPKVKQSDVAYTVIERTTNPDYQLTEPTTQVVYVEGGKVTTTYFRDFQKQIVEGHKVDAITGVGIPGVQYQITQVDGKGAWKAVTTTGPDGKFSWKDVPDGTYTVHEVSTVSGYILDPTPQVVTVRNGMAPSLKFINSKFPGITITKLDKQTGEVVTKPATFRIEQIDGTYTADVTTQNGIVNLKELPVGSYKITELSAPDGYVLDTTPGTIYLGEGEAKTYFAQNLKTPTLTIEKIDGQTGAPISGVKFEIKKDGVLIGTVTTGGIDGKVIVGGENSPLGYLQPGLYSVTEVFVPEPYVLPTDGNQHQDIYLAAGDKKTLTFANLEMPEIVVEKYDEQTGEKLPGAQFAIYEQSDTSRPVVEGMTDAQGNFKSGKIMPGTYVVKELLPPPSYMLSDKTGSERVIVAKAGDGVITVKVDNIKLPKLIIKKIDAVTKQPLAGVTFRVELTDDKSVQPSTATTNAQGIIEIPNLIAGTYTVTEISVPSNYILDSTPQTVKMEAGDNKTLLFENTKYPTLVITKTDYSTNKPVPNTTFKVEYENTIGGTKFVGTYRTNENGRIVLPFVKVGWYVLTETIPAQGMQLPSNPVTRIYLSPGTNSYTNTENGNVGGNGLFTVTSGLDYPVVAGVVNYPLNSIVIKKSDANTGEMLAGATFELIKTSGSTSGQNGTTIGTFTTDVSGVIVVTGLEGGTYAIREIKAPPNYIISETSLQTLTMKADGTSIIEVLFNNHPYGAISIDKTDGITGLPLAGATFKVTDNAGAVVGDNSYTTDGQGNILVPNVKPGSYVITELTAPDGYAIDTTSQTILIGTDGKIYKVSFVNYPAGTLVIKKLDFTTKEPLENAEFKVTTAKGDVVGNGNGIFKTDATGAITIPKLPKGSYVVEELKAPDGYILENQTKTIDVDYGNTYTLEFFNKKMASLIISKIDSQSKQPLANATFKVMRKNGDVVGQYNTDGNGIIQIDELEPGWYSAVEVKAPNGYLLDNTPQDFEVTHTKTVTLTFENKPMSSLIISKIDSQSRQPLANATFKIMRKNGDVIGQYSTDGNGIIQLDELEPGWYSAVEVKAPDGYLLDNTPQDFEVTHTKTVTLTFENKPMSSLILKKIDANTKAPLMGARFKITKKSGEVIGEYGTNANGIIQIDNLPPGWYSATEVKAPTGYKLVDVAIDFEVTNTKTVTIEFPNEKLTSLIIKKVDDKTGEPLSGAKFYVEKQNGVHVGEYSTDNDGLINLPTLTPDWYIIREIKAPDGYLLDESPKTIEVKTDVPTIITFTNKKLTALQIKKVDELSGEPLGGAKFAVEKQNGERVGEYTTDNTGFINIPTLDPDWYVVRETKAPTGYLLDETPKTVEVKTNAPTVVTFTNKKLTALQIKKEDEKTGEPLGGAKFSIEKQDGQLIGEYTTDNAGFINIPTLDPDWYVVKEIQAPNGYLLDETPKTVEVKTDEPTVVKFVNKKLTALQIKKVDELTGEPLGGAKFAVEKQNGERVGEYTTDNTGFINIPTLDPDIYAVRETKAPTGYLLDETPKTVEIKTNVPTVVTFTNKKLTALQIKKEADKTGEPLSGAKFAIEKQDGQRVGEYTTDKAGFINIPTLDPDWYVVKEIKAPDGYLLDETPKTVQVKTDVPTVITFVNKKLTALQIKKVDELSGEPLGGAKFAVEKQNGERVGEYTTDNTGFINIPTLDPDWYVVRETKAPTGYLLDETPKTVEIKTNAPTVVTFTNKKLTALQIKKEADKTGEPLSGAKFAVEKQDGQRIGEYTTDKAGIINIPTLAPDWYIVKEIQAPDGFLLNETPKTVQVKTDVPTVVTFINRKLTALQIKKIDEITGEPLTGAKFAVEKQNGERIGEYSTDETGFINIPELLPDWYVVRERKAPEGYILDETPKTVEVKTSKPTVVTFTNKPLSGVQIKKINSVTRQPIEGVEFSLSKMNGEKIGNFKTGKDGLIFISELQPGWYSLYEVKAAHGYILDSQPRNFEVKYGKPVTLEIENTPMSGLLIIKTDANTGKPLQGVVFDVKRADGSFVAGNILDGNQPGTSYNSPNKTTSPNGDITGSYTTDANGRIQINGLEAGQYNVTERKALDGYELDTNVHNVTVTQGKMATLQLTNKPKAGLRILKIDSITKKGIYNVEFMLFDETGKVIGTYYSDNNGAVDFAGIITPGRYTIRETRPAEGYYNDDIPKTINFESGKYTEIVWENIPKMGQIQITKKSANDNEVNGLPAGTPLAGAIFEVYAHKSGNLVDRFVSGNDGKAVSKPLPTGRYIVKEVQAPQYYKLNPKELDIEIEFATQIIKLEFTNESANTGVYIKKTGNVEAMPSDTIRYDIKAVQNVGTVPLTDFYWRDVIPVDAVRLNKIVTGTYNQSLKYKILATTNKGDTKVIADNLSTTQNNVIDCSNASLGLRSDEFVTSFTLVFGNVKAGFAQVEQPQVFVTLLKTLPSGYQFSNKCDVGGKYGTEWVIGNSTWLTTVYRTNDPKLPKTGY